MGEISLDKEYRYQRGGTATILTTDRQCQGRWTVVSMSENGALRFHDAFGVEKNNYSSHDLVEVSKWECFRKGQIVEVLGTDGRWRLRRFYGVSIRNKPISYNDFGEDGSHPVTWEDCRVPEDCKT